MNNFKQYRASIFACLLLIMLFSLPNPARAGEADPENQTAAPGNGINQTLSEQRPYRIQHAPANAVPLYSYSERGGDGLPLEAITVPIESQIMAAPTPPPEVSSHSCRSCIMSLLQEGLIQGYSDGTIRPDREVTRAEVAYLLANSAGLRKYELQNRANPFNDELPIWAEEAISICYEKGIMRGYPDGSFNPDHPVAAIELCVALSQAYPGICLESFDLAYADSANIPDWALSSIKAEAGSLYILGYPGRDFQPFKNISRAEFCSILCHIKDRSIKRQQNIPNGHSGE